LKKSSNSPSGENATDPSAHSVLKGASPPAASASPPGQSAALSGQPGQTAWLMVSLAIFAGILAATQVGKAHIALPAIRSDLHLSLVAASWLISAMNFLGLFGASLVGILAARYGFRRFITLGLVVLAGFGFYGSTATGELPLMISRFFEGVGFMMVIIGAPSLIAAVTQEKERRFALGAWGAFMPGGIALATWLAPSVMAHAGWRGLWAWGAAVLLVFAVIFEALTRRAKDLAEGTQKKRSIRDILVALANPGAVSLALIFGCYTLQHLGIMALFPSFLKERFHLPAAEVGQLDSIAMTSNILGNVAAGYLLQRGVSRAFLMQSALLVMAISGLGIFSLNLPWQGSFAFAFVLCCVGGIVPGCVLASVPHFSGTQVAAVNGLVVQGSNLGIVLGPILISSVVARYGWPFAPVVAVAGALIGAAFVFALSRCKQTAFASSVHAH
jgi:MFS transporter, DHA1 family, inner membrane transport protein